MFEKQVLSRLLSVVQKLGPHLFAPAVLIVLIAILTCVPAKAQKIYWNGNGTKVQRANLDGSNVEDLVTGISLNLYSGTGLAIDEMGGKVYWSQPDLGVRRANLEIPPGETASARTDIELLYGFSGSVWDFAIDPTAGKLYFTTAGPGNGKVLRSNLDGSNLEELVTGVCCNQRGIDLDIGAGKMYWVTGSPGRIQRANLEIPAGETASNRTDIEVLISDSSNYQLVSLALDLNAGKIYFTRPGVFPILGWPPINRKIQRANLDGSNIEDLVTGQLDLPTGLALDLEGGKMYWGDNDTLKRANLEIPAGETPAARTDIEELVVGAGAGGYVLGVALSGAAPSDFIVQKLVDTETPLPGQSFPFRWVHSATLDSGVVTFLGEGDDTVDSIAGIYRAVPAADLKSPAILTTVVDNQSPLPENEGFFSGFDSLTVNEGSIGFRGTGLSSTGAVSRSLYADWGAGEEFVIGDWKDSLLYGSRVYSAYAPSVDREGITWQSLFEESASRLYCRWGSFGGCSWTTQTSRRRGIYSNFQGQIVRVVDDSTYSPSIDGTQFQYFCRPSADSGQVAFGATYYDSGGLYRDGVYSYENGPLRVVADRNTVIPGTGQVGGVNTCSVVASSGEVAFIGYYRDASGNLRNAILAESGGALLDLVDTASTVPGVGATFAGFSVLSLNGGNVAFTADYYEQASGARATLGQGLFLRHKDRLRKVVVSSDKLDGRYVRSLDIQKQSLEGTRLVFTAHLQTEGSRSSTPAIYLAVLDSDRDGVPEDSDNCPEVANSNQEDSDSDGEGDACQDTDGDLVLDVVDNCPLDRNLDQLNSDGDDFGDACDNCADVDNPDQENIDGDDWGDACDPDRDNDTYLDENDNCPSIANDQSDLDTDGQGDVCDADDDGDGILDPIDGVVTGGTFVDESATVSVDFTDEHLGGSSFGTIQSTGGLILEVSDAAEPSQGLRIHAIGGRGTAWVRICGISGGTGRIRLDLGDMVDLTCGSASIEAVTDQVELLLADDESIVVAVPNAVGAKIEDVGPDEFKLSNEFQSPDDVKLTLGEVLVTVPAAATASVTETPSGQFLIENATESLQPITAEVGGQIVHLNPGELPKLVVAIDIKPGDEPNSINLGSGGNTPVAILSSSNFDATLVDPVTVTLASAPVKLKGKGTPQFSVQDVNADGLQDLIVHIDTSALQLSEVSVNAVLDGLTYEGVPVRGTDQVRVVP